MVTVLAKAKACTVSLYKTGFHVGVDVERAALSFRIYTPP